MGVEQQVRVFAAPAAALTAVYTETLHEGKCVLMQNLPVWIGWFHYLDFLHYAWACLMLNEFEHKNTVFIGNQTV